MAGQPVFGVSQRFPPQPEPMNPALDASPAKVFAAFAEASLVSRWLTPSPDVALTVLEFDFRVGGGYRFAYSVPGRATMVVNGVYRTIEPLSTIVFSWNIEPPDEHAGVRSEVTITLTPEGTGTDLRIRHEQLTQPGVVRTTSPPSSNTFKCFEIVGCAERKRLPRSLALCSVPRAST